MCSQLASLYTPFSLSLFLTAGLLTASRPGLTKTKGSYSYSWQRRNDARGLRAKRREQQQSGQLGGQPGTMNAGLWRTPRAPGGFAK